MTEGEEGLVCVDEDNKAIYKIKPRHNVDAVILGFTESPDTPDSLRVLLVGLMRPDNSFQIFAKVGTGFDDEQRREREKDAAGGCQTEHRKGETAVCERHAGEPIRMPPWA